MFFIYLILVFIAILIFMIFLEIEKILDNTFEIGNYLDKQDKREKVFAKNLQKYVDQKKGKK